MHLRNAKDLGMKLDNGWILLLVAAAGAAVGVFAASRSRRRQRQSARVREDRSQIKDWENEGGNLAPVPAALALP
jgi:hypothetical protein